MVTQTGMKDQRDLGMIQETRVIQKHLIGFINHCLIRKKNWRLDVMIHFSRHNTLEVKAKGIKSWGWPKIYNELLSQGKTNKTNRKVKQKRNLRLPQIVIRILRGTGKLQGHNITPFEADAVCVLKGVWPHFFQTAIASQFLKNCVLKLKFS